MHYDIFNGDADGIISLLQLRRSYPMESILISGVKRDIQLLHSLEINGGDSLTILDISMEKNKKALTSILTKAASVFYVDHHQCGDIPVEDNLNANIDLSASTCTALIIDKLLDGQYRDWAITAAYGDNLINVANQLAGKLALTDKQTRQLRELGTLINYNGYGHHVDELHYHPINLYQQLSCYTSPFDVINDPLSPFHQLKNSYQNDVDVALEIKPFYTSEILVVIELPSTSASRRVSGVFGNLLANQSPKQAHVILTRNATNDFTVSLRAPLMNQHSAGKICTEFSTGGGREAAAGINKLPLNSVDLLINKIELMYSLDAI